MSQTTSKNKRKINWTPEKVMSTSAVLISLISLIALFYQLKLSREENALIRKQQSANVLPHLSIAFSTSPEQYQITFVNKGVGPAFIKEVEFSMNGNKKFERSDFLFNEIRSIVKEREEEGIAMSTYSFQKGEVIPAGQEVNILTVRGESSTELFRKHFSSIDIDYSIIYEDVYGARWKLSWDDEFPVSIPISK